MGRWGSGLFQGDMDLDLADDLTLKFPGLTKLQEEAVVKAKAAGESDEAAEDSVYYILYRPCCSDPELVRQHLDSGVLSEVIEDMEKTLLSIPQKYEGNTSWYDYVLLGACAMTLGCRLPDSYIGTLKKVYTEVGLLWDGLKQMKKALFDPDGFKNGTPYEFESKSLIETANVVSDGTLEDDEPSDMSYLGNPWTSKIIKELRDKYNFPDLCGGCGAESREDGKYLLGCAKCKDRLYCSKKCQKKHWKVHKTVCESVEE